MQRTTNEISIERLLEQDIPQLVRFGKDIVMISDFGDMSLFSHPVRLRATTVLVCIRGTVDCHINLHRHIIRENQMLVTFAGDIIHIARAQLVAGYAIIISEDYLQHIHLDFRFRAQTFISLRDNGPIPVPHDELIQLKPYYTLLKKNMEEGNAEVINGLTIALSHTIIALLRRYQPSRGADAERDAPRAEQIFNRFMQLLGAHHTSERSLRYYADRMCLTPKYISGAIRSFSGRGALEWINEYVVLEAEMMLRYTDMSIQEVAYALNFPTQSAFGKYFKEQLGVSPRQYRNKA